MRLYSKTTGNCYLPGIHTVVPEDAVEIPDERYQSVIANPTPGKARGHDDTGLPILIDPPEPSREHLAVVERGWRDGALAACQWLRDRHRDQTELNHPSTLTNTQFVELLGYLQALRDWPQSEQFPDVNARPVAPPWIVDHQTQ